MSSFSKEEQFILNQLELLMNKSTLENVESVENVMFDLYKKYEKQSYIQYMDIVMIKVNILVNIFTFNQETKVSDVKVELKRSPIHGKGVFATRNIKMNEIITFYPIDAVIVTKNFNTITFISERYKNKYKGNMEKARDSIKKDYKYMFDLNWTIYGDPSFGNLRKYNPLYIGHMINDAPDFNPANCNSFFHNLKGDLGVAIVAKKNIMKGEEILVSYGAGYWIARRKICRTAFLDTK